MTTVRAFLRQMYRLITAQSPTMPLHGDDEQVGLQVLNQILSSYASSGLLLPIAKTVTTPINLGIKELYFTSQDYTTITTSTEIVNLVTGSPDFTVINGAAYRVGDGVSGNGILPNTIIAAITGNLVTLSQNALVTGASSLTFIQDDADPTVTYIKEGRLANLDSAWLLLNGVTYPLIIKSRDEFLAAWKYEPLQGLPRFIIVFPETSLVRAQLYPAPSQFYTFNCRAKFQKFPLTINDTLDTLPAYQELFLLYAVAKYVSKFKGRGSAWTPDLEAEYRELKAQIEAASEVNLSIAGDEQSLLNGAWRTRAGI